MSWAEEVVEQVEDFCRAEGLVEEGESVLLAVSGGSDSTALVAIFAALRERLRLRLHVGHLNHSLRGAESDADAAFVATLAERFQIPATIETAEVEKIKREKKRSSLEAVARQVRYAFLDATARKIGAQKIALAHHREDLAETLLMHLLRGAGSGGLAGIRPIREKRWIRPLLFLTKEELRRFLEVSHLSYREDRSNNDRRFLRNRIRHELLPTLKTYNPRVVEALARAAETLSEEDAYLQTLSDDLRRSLTREGNGLAANGLLQAPRALRRRVVRDWLSALLKGEEPPTFAEVVALCDFLEDPQRCQLTLRRRFLFTSEEGVLRLEPPPITTIKDPVPLCVPGETFAEGMELLVVSRLTPKERWKPTSWSRYEAAFDWERLPKPLSLRLWQHGDRFQPFGMKGTKSVGKALSDANVRGSARQRVAVVLAGKEIVWVVGIRADGRYPVTEETQTVLHLIAVPRKNP